MSEPTKPKVKRSRSQMHYEFSSTDPTLAGALEAINTHPVHSSIRQELEATLFIQMARLCWQEAERLRVYERGREIRRQRRDAVPKS